MLKQNHIQILQGLHLQAVMIRIWPIFLLQLSWVIYDVFGTENWLTSMVIMYNSIFYIFILFWILDNHKKSILKFDKITLKIMSIPVIFRILLEFVAIGQDRQGYNEITSNVILDRITWIILVIGLTIQIWAKYTQSHRG